MTPSENLQAQLDAMRAGDTAALDSLLTEDFTLTHMTGYQQAKQEWLDEMADGLFIYHSIELVSLTVEGDVITARTITDATVYGGRGTWRLQLKQRFARGLADDWLASESVATTF